MKDFKSTLLKPASFEESGTEIPCVILGDEAYSLKMYIMKSFARKDFSGEEHVFKYRLSRARRCVERAFGILTSKLLNKATEMNVNKAEIIVRYICLLHIIIIIIITYLEETTRDPSVLQETVQIHKSHHAKPTSAVDQSVGPQQEQ